MKQGLVWLDRNFEICIISALLVGITGLSAIQVVLRYGFSALSWVEELVVFFHVWIGFIGLGYAVLRDNNLRVDLIDFLPRKFSFWLKEVANFITFCTYLYLGYYGIAVIQHSAFTGQVSPAAEIPMTYLYAAFVVGAALASFRYLQRVYRIITGTITVYGGASCK